MNRVMKPTQYLSVLDVIAASGSYFHCTAAALQSHRRHKSVTHARQVCMYLARQHTNMSLSEIGTALGGRDHTTVLHAEAKIKSLIAKGGLMARQIADLDAEMTERRSPEPYELSEVA